VGDIPHSIGFFPTPGAQLSRDCPVALDTCAPGGITLQAIS
jgi:hypothetical protein